MKKDKRKYKRIDAKSRDPHRRREESEMGRIVQEVQSGLVGIREACFKYGLCRGTLKLWITRLTVQKFSGNLSSQFLASMTDNQKSNAIEKRIHDLQKALDLARLKIDGLETMIKVAEEHLHIKIRKKRGTKQSIK